MKLSLTFLLKIMKERSKTWPGMFINSSYNIIVRLKQWDFWFVGKGLFRYRGRLKEERERVRFAWRVL